MRSPRTDGRRRLTFEGLRRPGPLSRLNVRLVLTLWGVALIGLVVSAIAMTQILPGYFEEQTQGRLATAAASTLVLIDEFAIQERTDPNSNVLQVRELRENLVLQKAAGLSAQVLIPATVEIVNDEGQRVAYSTPADAAELRAQGLRPDATVDEVRQPFLLEIPTSEGEVDVRYELIISRPFTSRAATLDQIQSAIVGAGLLALLASLIVGVIAARRVTAPIGRLRRVAAKVAHGELDERAEPSGVLEIDELGAQFNATADRLAESLRMLEADRDRLREFVADVSHELRTPIAALRTFTELQDDGEVDEATRREFLERSRQQISRLEWLSTNLLDLSRIDAGIFPMDVQWGDLRDPLRSVVEAHAEVAERRGIALTSEVPAAPVELRYDHERIVQLATNLVGNALKFTPRGGQVALALADMPGSVVIEVHDSGAGIPAEELPRIFDRFYRGTNTGEARASGSGLGLAIARSIVEMHGGQIDVASVVGEGTVFRIELPKSGRASPTSVPQEKKDQ